MNVYWDLFVFQRAHITMRVKTDDVQTWAEIHQTIDVGAPPAGQDLQIVAQVRIDAILDSLTWI